MPWLHGLIALAAHGQGFEGHRPLVPSAGIAAEDGPAALWVNPANLAYDPDPRLALSATRDQLDERTLLPATGIGATAGIGGFGVGVHNLSVVDPARHSSDWSLSYATSLRLPGRLALGGMVSWNLVEGAENYAAWDVGGAWRPLPWLGFGAVAQAIGGPDPAGFARPRTGGGVAVRPLGDRVVVGLDASRTHETERFPIPRDLATASLRLRVAEGAYLRASADAALGTERFAALSRAGGGLEVYLGGAGAGFHADAVLTGQATGPGALTAWLGTGEPGESLVSTGRDVPHLTLGEAPPYDPRRSIFDLDPGPSWLEVLEDLRRLEDDRGVKGLLLTLDGASLSWARFRELRTRVGAMERRGKPVTVLLLGSPSNGAYYVASAASEVVLHPAGTLDLVGVSLELQNLRGVLDLVGVEAEFVRRSEYKSAPETYTEDAPSEPSLEQSNAILDGLHAELVGAIADGRGVTAEVVAGWIDGGPWSAAEALEKGMVDALDYPTDLEARLDGRHGGPVRTVDLAALPSPHSPWEESAEIAVINVDGAIVSGESSGGGLLSGRTTGSATVVRQLERAMRDRSVKAVVLRVDSPGGSAYASDEIWAATQRLKERDKPVVVSMGGVAASGGYYVAAGADRIWAEPTTITGSIGVFSGKVSLAELYDSLGIHHTSLTRGAHADARSLARPWTDAQRARVQSLVDSTYAQFKERVGDGRGMTHDEVEAVARGRVWMGAAAAEAGLVDALGGLPEAIADARELAGLRATRKVGLVTYSASGGPLSMLAPSFLVASRVGLVPRLRRPADPLTPLAPLLAPLHTSFLWAMHEEGVWLMSPSQADVVTR